MSDLRGQYPPYGPFDLSDPTGGMWPAPPIADAPGPSWRDLATSGPVKPPPSTAEILEIARKMAQRGITYGGRLAQGIAGDHPPAPADRPRPAAQASTLRLQRLKRDACGCVTAWDNYVGIYVYATVCPAHYPSDAVQLFNPWLPWQSQPTTPERPPPDRLGIEFDEPFTWRRMLYAWLIPTLLVLGYLLACWLHW